MRKNTANTSETEREIKTNTQQLLTPGAGHRRLDIFVGKWKTVGQTRANEKTPAVKVNAVDTYEWLPGGFFLFHRIEARMGDEEINGIEIIGYDTSRGMYSMHYFDNQGTSGIAYARIIDDKTWNFEGQYLQGGKPVGQRTKVVFSDGGNTITANWEQSADGSDWKPVVDVKLTRM